MTFLTEPVGPKLITPIQTSETPIPVDMEMSSVNEKLECEISGNPEPQIYWTKDGEKINPDFKITQIPVDEFLRKSILRFPEIRKGTAGMYSCIGKNRLGTKVQQDFAISVTSTGK